MQLRRYRARDTHEAYRAIKADLGEDALIVDVQKTRQGGLGGLFGSDGVEVLAAGGETTRASTANHTAPVNARLERLHTDLGDLRHQLTALSGQLAAGMLLPRPLQQAFDQLVERGIEPPLAQRLLEATQDELSVRALEDEHTLWETLRRCATRLVTAQPLLGSPADPGGQSTSRQVVFLIGPTGVGKTTTIAKLAAMLLLEQRRSVALVSIDTFRVGAVAQLQTYAEILGIPLQVAYDPQELADHVARNADKDYILVDTPGRSHRRNEHLDELRRFLLAVEPRQVLLTLALSTALLEALDIVQRFEVVPVDGLIVTKLDEVEARGCLLGLADRTARPFTYLTTGQNVPQDIECATPEGVAARALGRNDER